MVTRYTPTAARKNLYGIIKDVTDGKQAVEIVSAASGEDGVAIIPLSDWGSIKETMLLEQTGVLDIVRKREKDDSGFSNVDDLDWSKL